MIQFGRLSLLRWRLRQNSPLMYMHYRISLVWLLARFLVTKLNCHTWLQS